MKKLMRKYGNRLLIFVMIAAIAVAMTACKKKSPAEEAGSSAPSTQQVSGTEQQAVPANTDKTEAPAEANKTGAPANAETPAEEDKEEPAAGGENSLHGIIENNGDLEIIVPEGEETFGE